MNKKSQLNLCEMLLPVSLNMQLALLVRKTYCCFLFTWHWLKVSGSPLWACCAASHSAAWTNPRGSACPWRALQVSLLISRCSWHPIPPGSLDSSTTARYIMGWTGTERRSDKKFSKKILQRTLFNQWKGKGLEELWQFVGQNLSRETQQIVFASGTTYWNADKNTKFM